MAQKSLTVSINLDDKNFTRTLRGSQAELDRFIRKLKKGDESLIRNEKHTRSWGAGFRDTIVVLGLFQQAISTLNVMLLSLPRAIINTNAELERMETLLVGLTKKTSSFAEAERQAAEGMAFLFTQAKSSPFEVGILTDSFVKLRSTGLDFAQEGMKGFSKESDSAKYMLKALSDSVASFGGTSEVFHRASIAIQQMSGKGVISMEELRQQLGEAVPDAAVLMAQGLGLTMGELTKVVSTGQLEATKGLRALATQMTLFKEGASARMAATFVGMKNQIKTQLQLAAKAVNDSGMMDALVIQLSKFKDYLGSPEFLGVMRSLGDVMKSTFEAIPAIVDGFQRLYAILQPTVDMFGSMLSLVSKLIPSLGEFNGELSNFENLLSNIIMLVTGGMVFKKLAGWIGLTSKATGKVNVDVRKLSTGFKTLRASMLPIGATVAGIAGQFAGLQKGVAGIAATFAVFARNIVTVAATLGSAIVAFFGWPVLIGAAAVAAAAALFTWGSKTEELSEKQKELNEIMNGGKKASEEYFDVAVERKKDIEDQVDLLNKQRDAVIALSKAKSDAILARQDRGLSLNSDAAVLDVGPDTSALDGKIAELQKDGERVQQVMDEILDGIFNRAQTSSQIDEYTIEVANSLKSMTDGVGEQMEEMTARFAEEGLPVDDRIAAMAEVRMGLVDARLSAWGEKMVGVYEKINSIEDVGSDDGQKKLTEYRGHLAAIVAIMENLGKTKELIANGESIEDNLINGVKVKRASTAISELDGKIVKLQAKLIGSGTHYATMVGLIDKGLIKGTDKQIALMLEKAKQVDKLTESYSLQQKALKSLDQNEERLVKLRAARAGRAATLENDNPFLNSLGAAAKQIEEHRLKIRKLKEDIANGAFSEDVKGLEKAKQQIVEFGQEIDMVNLDTLNNSVKEVADAARDMNEAMMPESERMKAEHTRTLAYIEEIYAKFGDKISAPQDEALQNYKRAVEGKKTLASNGALYAAEKWSAGADDFGSAWASAFDGMSNVMADFIVTGEGNFKGFAQSMAKMITQMTMKLLVLKGVQMALGINFGGDSGYNMAGGKVAPGSKYKLGGIHSSEGSVPLRKYAQGGVAYSPQLALFGEGSQPEAYVPLPDGRTIPVTMKSEGKGGESGGQTNVAVNVINQTSQQVQAQESGRRFDGRQMIVDVVLSEMSKPGRVREAIKGAR